MLKINFKVGLLNRKTKYKSATPMKLIKEILLGTKKYCMFKQNSKYRLIYLILALLVFALGSILAFYDYVEKKDGMRLFGGIVFGLMAIFQAGDLYTFIKNKKSGKLNSADKSTSE